MITINNTIQIPGFVIHSEEFMKDRDDYAKRLEQRIRDLEKALETAESKYRSLSYQVYGGTNP